MGPIWVTCSIRSLITVPREEVIVQAGVTCLSPWPAVVIDTPVKTLRTGGSPEGEMANR